jgi:3-hydroxybutyryl-CoA dehydrogenase
MSGGTIEKVVVVGGGVMGNGIAQVVAQAGLQVTVVDVAEDALERTVQRIGRSLARFVKSERLTQEEADAAKARISTSTDLEGAGAQADHVIETVVEDIDVKSDVLRRLDGACREEVILASNTSQFSISRLAAATSRPDRVIGSHWFNPPPMMDLIEVIRGVETSDETLRTTLELAERYGKRTVVCRKDTPGFITSRLIVALMLEAMRIVEEGIADADDVDLACQKAFNHAMGPLDTADFSGLDTTLKVAENMRDSYGERFLAPQNLRALVAAGHLGRKAGRGIRFQGEES